MKLWTYKFVRAMLFMAHEVRIGKMSTSGTSYFKYQNSTFQKMLSETAPGAQFSRFET